MRRFLVIVVALLALSCGRVGSTLFVDMHSVDLHCWSKPVTILYQNSDTLSLRDIAVALRYNDNFEDDTLSVVIQTSLLLPLSCEPARVSLSLLDLNDVHHDAHWHSTYCTLP